MDERASVSGLEPFSDREISPPLSIPNEAMFENARRDSVGVIPDSNDSKIRGSVTGGFPVETKQYPVLLGALS